MFLALRETYKMPLKDRNWSTLTTRSYLRVIPRGVNYFLFMDCTCVWVNEPYVIKEDLVTESKKTQSEWLKWDNGSFRWMDEIWHGWWRCDVDSRGKLQCGNLSWSDTVRNKLSIRTLYELFQQKQNSEPDVSRGNINTMPKVLALPILPSLVGYPGCL